MGTTFTVETGARTDVQDVTERVADALPAEAESVCTVFVRHTTAGVVVNEAESRLLDDIERAVGGLVHDEIDDNSVERSSTSSAA